MKPGWQTTEFWVTLVIQLMGILVLTGVYDPQIAGEVNSELGAKVDLVMTSYKDIAAFIAMAVSGFGYSRSRGEAKTK